MSETRIIKHGGNVAITPLPGNSNRAERTPGAVAVSQLTREEGGLSSSFSPSSSLVDCQTNSSPQKSQSRTRRLARHYTHMKKAGAYLDYMQYYFDDQYGEITRILEYCHTSWHRESKGEDIRYRANGCGRRFDCPLCGSYVQSQLALDASNNMTMAKTALDVAGVEYQNYGLKLVFTVPKDTSTWIDEMLFNNSTEWAKEVNRLYKSVSMIVNRWFGVGVAYLMNLEVTGESNPVEPHYHISVYVFPARYEGGEWHVLESYTDKLDEWRGEWTAEVNSLYNLKLDNADFRYNFLGTMGQMRHWLRYMYRPILADLWRGWVNYDGVGLEYRYKKNHQLHELYLPREDLDKAFDRARFIPKHFKRIRWGGIFSDGLRAKTMENILGLERVEKRNSDTSEAEGWVRDVAVFRLIKYEDDGILLRNQDTEEVHFVPDKIVDYRPDGVRTGRRVRWCEPGSQRALYDANLVLHGKADTTIQSVMHCRKCGSNEWSFNGANWYCAECAKVKNQLKGGLINSACGCREVTK